MVDNNQKIKRLTMSDDEIAKELLANAENKSSGKMNYFSRLGRRFIHTIGIHEYKTLK